MSGIRGWRRIARTRVAHPALGTPRDESFVRVLLIDVRGVVVAAAGRSAPRQAGVDPALLLTPEAAVSLGKKGTSNEKGGDSDEGTDDEDGDDEGLKAESRAAKERAERGAWRRARRAPARRPAIVARGSTRAPV